MTTLLISAGDASGDLHAADFVREFRLRHKGSRILGLGGDEMRKAGVDLVVESTGRDGNSQAPILGDNLTAARADDVAALLASGE